jgi:putative transposase
MPWYRRYFKPGGTFFFTLVTEGRAPFLCDDSARRILHDAIDLCRQTRPFTLDAIVLLPDHLHAIWTLPDNDADFSTRWAFIKSTFTRHWLAAGGRERPRSASRLRTRRRGVWQRQFWEHCLRDENDLHRHLDYIHYNPVKHALAPCPHAWPWSTFPRFVDRLCYDPAWLCTCDGRHPTPLSFDPLLPHEFD